MVGPVSGFNKYPIVSNDRGITTPEKIQDGLSNIKTQLNKSILGKNAVNQLIEYVRQLESRNLDVLDIDITPDGKITITAEDTLNKDKGLENVPLLGIDTYGTTAARTITIQLTPQQLNAPAAEINPSSVVQPVLEKAYGNYKIAYSDDNATQPLTLKYMDNGTPREYYFKQNPDNPKEWLVTSAATQSVLFSLTIYNTWYNNQLAERVNCGDFVVEIGRSGIYDGKPTRVFQGQNSFNIDVSSQISLPPSAKDMKAWKINSTSAYLLQDKTNNPWKIFNGSPTDLYVSFIKTIADGVSGMDTAYNARYWYSMDGKEYYSEFNMNDTVKKRHPLILKTTTIDVKSPATNNGWTVKTDKTGDFFVVYPKDNNHLIIIIKKSDIDIKSGITFLWGANFFEPKQFSGDWRISVDGTVTLEKKR